MSFCIDTFAPSVGIFISWHLYHIQKKFDIVTYLLEMTHVKQFYQLLSHYLLKTHNGDGVI